MIGTEFLKGQGLGNQLFCYVSARCIAKDLGYDFGTAGQEQLGMNIHSRQGLYFMDLDLGEEILHPEQYHVYQEKDRRLYQATCVHDMTHGCYVAGADEGIYQIPDHTLLYGNLQAERYFRHHREEIREWLKVRPEYDSMEFHKENLCVINIRGGEYRDSRVLFLRRKYWLDAMAQMRKIREDMEFMTVTDDPAAARWVLPEVKAFHFDLAGDYTAIKNASYLILSNSSFAFFPAFTSTTVKKIIAPKYWARHNCSHGYWASAQNIYEDFCYLDRQGRLWDAASCRREWEAVHRSQKEGGTAPFSPSRIRMRGWQDQILYYADKAVGRLRKGTVRKSRGQSAIPKS